MIQSQVNASKKDKKMLCHSSCLLPFFFVVLQCLEKSCSMIANSLKFPNVCCESF